jgi:urease accessory protein
MKNTRSPWNLITFLTALLLMPTAHAHAVGGSLHAFHHGFDHPFTGLDHLLAMLAIGLWAAQMGGRATWMLPCVFVGATALGGVFGSMGWPLVGGEVWIAGSVLMLGALVVWARKFSLSAAGSFSAICGLAHGHAHGLESAMGTSSGAYAGGFLVATILLHLLGLAVGMAMVRTARSHWIRWTGGGIVASFIALTWV